MRILLNITIPHDDFNAAVRDGSVGNKIKSILDDIKPEAVYFTDMHGQRGAVMIVDLPDASGIPALAEPWFLTFRANVEFKPIMSPVELAHAGLEAIGKKWA
jgi:Fe-S-cluster formation regulator IscX/YfhJ